MFRKSNLIRPGGKMSKFAMKITTAVLTACCAIAVAAPAAQAVEVRPNAPALLASPAMVSASQDDRENVEIALRFVDSSGMVPTFDREGAVSAGLDTTFANEFEAQFNATAAQLATSASSSDSSQRAQESASIFPPWFNCAVAIAGLAGATVAAVAAIFASGGALAFALATYGLSGVSVLGSCYDANGNPIV